MNLRQFFVGRAVGFLVVLILIGGFYLLNSYIYNEKQGDPNFVPEPQKMELSGKFVCLPHKNTGGAQTMECAYGLLADNSFYYALDFGLMSQTLPEFITERRVTLGGVFTPVEYLSSDHWQKYDIVGIFSVTNIK